MSSESQGECRRNFEMTGTWLVWGILEKAVWGILSPSYLLLSDRGMCSSVSPLSSRRSSHCPQLPKNSLAPEVCHSLQTILCHFFPNLSHHPQGMSVLSWFLRWRLYNLRERRKGTEVRGEIKKFHKWQIGSVRGIQAQEIFHH